MPEFKIEFEDEYLLIVDKPANLLAVPGSDREKDLTTLLCAERNQKVYPCHRLDKETSGLMIFAKTGQFQETMMEKFKTRQVKKTYLAFVQGRIKTSNGQLQDYISGAWPYREKGPKKLAITKFKCIFPGPKFSVLEVEPITGRTNQIRIQFKIAGYPLVGERRFAVGREAEVKFRRVALHAAKLEFIHPWTKNSLVLSAAIPEDMRNFLTKSGVNLSSGFLKS